MVVTVVLLTTKQLQIYLNKKRGEGWEGFNGIIIIIQTHGLCVSATVLYQLSYKDSYIGPNKTVKPTAEHHGSDQFGSTTLDPIHVRE